MHICVTWTTLWAHLHPRTLAAFPPRSCPVFSTIAVRPADAESLALTLAFGRRLKPTRLCKRARTIVGGSCMSVSVTQASMRITLPPSQGILTYQEVRLSARDRDYLGERLRTMYEALGQ